MGDLRRWYWHRKADGRVVEVEDSVGGWVMYDDAMARIRELEAERDEAHARGVREGIERVRREAENYDGMTVGEIEADEPFELMFCTRALAAFEAEQEQQR